jgi:hypothetical protein
MRNAATARSSAASAMSRCVTMRIVGLDIAARIAAVGRVTVSLRRSIQSMPRW